jgi:hypothetical protein
VEHGREEYEVSERDVAVGCWGGGEGRYAAIRRIDERCAE